MEVSAGVNFCDFECRIANLIAVRIRSHKSSQALNNCNTVLFTERLFTSWRL